MIYDDWFQELTEGILFIKVAEALGVHNFVLFVPAGARFITWSSLLISNSKIGLIIIYYFSGLKIWNGWIIFFNYIFIYKYSIIGVFPFSYVVRLQFFSFFFFDIKWWKEIAFMFPDSSLRFTFLWINDWLTSIIYENY